MLQFKIFAAALLAVFLAVQVYLIANEFWGTRTIEIKMKRYGDSAIYLKGIHPDGVPLNQFVVRVKPQTLGDILLLTNSKGNLLGILFKIAAAIVFTCFIFNLSYSSLFSIKSFNLIWLAVALVGCVLIARCIGLNHTRDFWNKLYASEGGGHDKRFDLYIDTRYGLKYYAIPVIFILSIYRYFIAQHAKVSNNLAEVEQDN